MSYVEALAKKFESYQNKTIAAQQSEYMRFQFEYYGLKAPTRQQLQKPFLQKDQLPPKSDMEPILRELWNRPQREFQYFGLDFVLKYKRYFEKRDIALFEHMITAKSWWDTVDMVAGKVMGIYHLSFPEERTASVDRWLSSGNMWLQRTAILLQLKYKDKTDTDLLKYVIEASLGTQEFFINKAIGWVLREYGKTNPQWVLDFVANTTLDPLSHSEALKRLT